MNCEVYSSLVGFYRIIRVLIKSCAETTHSISDADPSMLSKHADIYRPPHYNTTLALNTLTELSLYIQLSGFLIPFLCFSYLGARLNREKVGHLDLRQTFQVTAHNTSRPTGDQHRLSISARRR